MKYPIICILLILVCASKINAQENDWTECFEVATKTFDDIVELVDIIKTEFDIKKIIT